jgi:pimeloyl-ACP methyl ester carboxylesterase
MAEQTLILGAENHLVATFTPPDPGASHGAPPVVALLTNSGVIPRSGPHRMNVHIARRLAALGIPSVRFDMSGLGDSRRSNSTLPVVEQWVADTRSVMDAAQAQFGSAKFLMVGFCSGAEVAHLVALEDSRLRAILLWDLYAYPSIQTHIRTFLYKLRRAGALGTLRKLGERLSKTLMKKPEEDSAKGGRQVEVSLVPPLNAFAQRVERLTDSGVELLFVYCGGEPEWFNHAGQFKSMFGRYPFYDKIAFHYLQVSDHLITTAAAQQAFLAMSEDWLKKRVLPAVSTYRPDTNR